jgi:hypothetical protein
MRTWLLTLLLLSVPTMGVAQDAASEGNVRPESEIPDDMPEAPEDAPPAEATAVGATADRPPHPKTPDPLAEPQPTAEMLSKTMYHWLPGRWLWTSEQFEWKSGTWVYEVEDMILVPPRWEWSEERKQWVFHDAGWAKPGTNVAVYSPTAAPGGPEVVENAEKPPANSEEPKQQKQPQVTVYLWTGVYRPPVIVYPRWHPYYHYHWYHRNPHYGATPYYKHDRYQYAKAHHDKNGTSPSHQPAERPSQQPAKKPSNPTQAPASSSARRTQKNYQTRRPPAGRPRR